LEDKTRIAVRGSGTEPKIKYYIFAQRRPAAEKFTAEELKEIKAQIGQRLEDIWDWIEKDAHQRVAQ
jgi:phosphoglucomutase